VAQAGGESFPRARRVRKRLDYLRVQGRGRRFSTPHYLVFTLPAEAPRATRFGVTVSRKVGNAVVRNRVRRRLREVAKLVIPAQARSDLDYVLVGRQGALKRDFATLQRELVEALRKLKALAVATP
jgi:ribonuclease P protein component